MPLLWILEFKSLLTNFSGFQLNANLKLLEK